MTPPDATSSAELDIRLHQLMEGPWRSAAKLAREVFAPPTFDSTPLIFMPIQHEKDDASEAMRARFLRPHWDSQVDDPREIEVRDSFDEALTEMQLLELAIQTGYLDLTTTVRDHARNLINQLLWSPSAVRFIADYDYITVRFLAARVGVDLKLPSVVPPEPVPAAAHFATFHSVLLEWETDDDLAAWLGWLDDYNESSFANPEAAFNRFLATGKYPRDPQNAHYFQRLVYGAGKFVMLLSTLFHSMNDEGRVQLDQRPGVDHRAPFGAFFSYWLARFHGYSLAKIGFEKDDRDLGRVLLRSGHFPYAEFATDGLDCVLSNDDEKLLNNASNERLKDDLAVLADTWSVTQRYLEQHATRKGKWPH